MKKKLKKRYGYRLFKLFVRLLLNHLLFRKHYILGKENLPAMGEPMIIPANHQNTAIDPIAMVLMHPEPVHPYVLAMGGVFTWSKIINAIWDWVGMLPAFRMDYEGVDEALKRTKYVVDFAATKMDEGYPVMLFPEMNHHDEHWMRVWTPGFLEIAFSAAEKSNFQEDVKVVPLAHHYSSYYGAQGSYLIRIGEPISLKPYYEEYKEKPRSTMRAIFPKIRERVKEMMLYTDDLEHHDLYDFVRKTKLGDEYAQKLGLKPDYLPERLESDKKLWADIEDGLANKADGPEIVEEMDKTWKAILKSEQALHLREHGGEAKRMSPLAIAASVLVQLALLPLWIVSLFPSGIMYFIPPLFMPGREDRYYKLYDQALQLIVSALVIIPVFMLATLLVLGLVWGWWWQAVVWILLWYPLALFAWYVGNWMRRTIEQITLRCHKAQTAELDGLYDKLYKLVTKLISK
ncbi:MAG: 1-acyl-sn-glycerol-3-phosphate acyltransferase [Paludibacteraceae bacterium]|nr:1-acyl-sn-glycerol-3-phosphate acyltransferase [Paludibacteraceae bacterium]